MNYIFRHVGGKGGELIDLLKSLNGSTVVPCVPEDVGRWGRDSMKDANRLGACE